MFMHGIKQKFEFQLGDTVAMHAHASFLLLNRMDNSLSLLNEKYTLIFFVFSTLTATVPNQNVFKLSKLFPTIIFHDNYPKKYVVNHQNGGQMI